MSFTLPDLVIEGAVRKGFDFLRLNAGVSPQNFRDIPDVSQINALVGEVYPSNLVLSGATITGTMRFPNVLSFFEDGNVIEFTRAGSLNFRVGDGVTARSDLIQGTTGLDVFIIGTLTFTGTPTLSNGFLQIPFSIDVTSGSNPTPSGVAAEYVTFANTLSPLGATIIWAIPGSRSGTEILGAGGEVLDMLFDFREGNDSIDGGLDVSVSTKYDQEPLRLREFFRENQIAIIQSFSDVQTNLPCISIQLASDGEDQGLALTDDFGGIDGTFDSDVPARDRIGRDENTIHANTVINVGIHTKEQLLTKYLYHITKYFILSAKEDLIRQNFIIATFRGSDFTRDAAWQGDHVYTRFLNISGKTEDSWVNLDEIVDQLEEVGINIFVPQVGAPAQTIPTDGPVPVPNSPPAQDVGGDNFVNASPIFSSVTTAQASLQLPNSLYHTGNGMAVFVQRDGTGRQLFQSAPFNITNNDKARSILSAVGINPSQDSTGSTTYIDGRGNTQTVAYVSNTDSSLMRVDQRILEVFEPATGTTSPVSTVQTPPPSGLVSSQLKQNIDDADGVIHRSDVNQSDL